MAAEKRGGLRLMKDQGKVSQCLLAFILCHVGSDSVVYWSYALQGTSSAAKPIYFTVGDSFFFFLFRQMKSSFS